MARPAEFTVAVCIFQHQSLNVKVYFYLREVNSDCYIKKKKKNPSATTKLLKGKVTEGNLGKKSLTIILLLNYNYLKISGNKAIE